jgi:hypothetical protein
VVQLRPADEGVHAPGIEEKWSESWGFDFSADDGTAGFVRLRTWPQLGVAWWWAYLVRTDLGILVVRDHEVPLPHRPDVLEIRADSLWGELVCETPFEHWGIGMEAFGLDVEWEEVSPVATHAHGDGYSQSGIVHGEVLVGRERLAFDGHGVRDHSWGPSDGVPGRRLTAMLGDDLAVDVVVDARGATSGWLWELGGDPVAVDAVLAEEQLGGAGVPVAARWVIAHRIELDIDLGPSVAIPGAALTRAPGMVTTSDGRRGTAWLEWRT